ncbi:MAG: hypothetical protein ABI581_07515 [Sediminibacterium sp.]
MKKTSLSEIDNLNLADVQSFWLSLAGNETRKKDIHLLIKEYQLDPDFITAVKISIDAARLGFFDCWEESIIDNILEEYVDESTKPFLKVFKEYVQFHIALENQGKRKINHFTTFIRAHCEALGWGSDWHLMPSLENESVYDVGTKSISRFEGGWQKPRFRKIKNTPE